MKKRILSIITALALVMSLLPAAALTASAAAYTAGSSDEFHDALNKAQDGDTIQLTGSFVAKNPASNNDSLVIDKAVTIQGGGLTLWYAGILLGADVTFKDITLGLASNVRPAIMANGHTLTLENVQRDPTARYIHLFCGGQTGATQGELAASKQGGHGQIILKGNTNLGLANIYAGSISTDGTNNVFAKPATVTIDPSFKGQPIEHIYACGALETPTSPDDWFDYAHEIAAPTPSASRFPVSGNVTFQLFGTAVKELDGTTGTAGKFADVLYSGTDYLNDGLVLANIGDLNVQSGNLTPANGSAFGAANASLTIAGGATLGLQNLGNTVTAGDFTGGGVLVLGQSQTLRLTGTVSGTTTVGIGGIFNGCSQAIPAVGRTYIDAASSQADSFTFAAPASRPDIKLVKEADGTWTARADENVAIVNDFKLASAVVEENEDTLLAFQDVSASRERCLYSLNLTIFVNGTKADWNEDTEVYTDSTHKLSVYVTDNDDQTGEILCISNAEDETASIPAGTYVISVTVPASNSGTGQPITRTATLTVKAAGAGTTTTIPDPVAKTGLVYNGQEQAGVPIGGAYELVSGTASAINVGSYTAEVKPADGFTWANGSADAKTVSWHIAKADNPRLPAGLAAIAPTAYGKPDGKLTGTTADMQYARSADFSGAENCGDGETTGLTAGGYYVRYKEDANHFPGPAVMVTVPQGPVAVQSIAIATPAGKTEYQVGETLDVTGLTLAVTMSDGSTHSVPVSARMVTGFDSSAAGQTKTLTITYGGQTATYTISIAASSLTVQSIAISSTGHKTAYKVGEPLDVTGLTLTVTMSDGSANEVSVHPGMVTGFDSSSAAPRQILTITHAGKTVTYTVSISEDAGTGAVTGVTLNKSAMTLTVGGSERLTATVSPDTAANKAVTWASQNTAVATVDAGGGVTAVSAGTAVITVTTQDGGKTASCTVTVRSSSGGSSGGGSSGGGSSGGATTTDTTRNPDGSTTTTVTNKSTGTVTETTRNTDGSTTVVETKRDGTVTTTDTARNGVKVETVSKPGADTSARVTLPASVQMATVTLPAEVTSGTVAIDAKTGEIVKLSVPTESGMTVRLDGSAELILEDRSKAFTDIDSHWAKSAIDFTTAHALFNGTSGTAFSPNQPMTRGMVAVVLHNFEGNPDTAVQSGFTDVASDKWYTDAINWAADKGIAGGYGNGSFGARDPVTREQLVTILYRYANAMGYSTESSADLSVFPDGDSVRGYAAEAMRWAVGSGLIVGTNKGVLAPRNNATRAQTAAILHRFVRSLMK